MRDFLDDRPLKLRRERPNDRGYWRLAALISVLVILSVLLIVFDQQGLVTPVRLVVRDAIRPLESWLMARRAELESWWSTSRDVVALQQRIDQLQAENARLNSELLRLEQARVENIFLRQQLAITRAYPWTILGAEVMIRAPDAARRVLTIARGTEDGVRSGMAVIGQQPSGMPALIGVVETVGSRTAEVLLITDISSQLSVRVVQTNGAPLGLMQGQWQLGSRLRLEPIDRSVVLREGERVVTAGLSGALDLPLDLAAMPATVPVGTITAVRQEGQRQVADLQPFVDPDQVQYVWVILSQRDPND